MPPRFSLVYPTRHRPAFVAQALAQLEHQAFSDFEIVVCDNFIDPELSCESVCRQSPLTNIRYVRPPEPLGMVDNWNFAAEQAQGDYVCVFTDKIFMLPGALERINRAIEYTNSPEIVNWVSDGFQPAKYPDYFGIGEYTAAQADLVCNAPAHMYDPRAALHEKCVGAVSRYEQTPSQYCRGKIVFGAYHRTLISRINERFGRLFFDISPDYTSMVLALSEATTACELSSSAVVSVATDISNGVHTSTNDALSLKYLQMLSGDANALMSKMLVPGLYASQANNVSHDYLALKTRFDLPIALDVRNWVGYCIEDLTRSDRVWSSEAVEQQQTQLMYQFVGSLSVEDQTAVVRRLESRFEARNRGDAPRPRSGQRLSWQTTSLARATLERSAWN